MINFDNKIFFLCGFNAAVQGSIWISPNECKNFLDSGLNCTFNLHAVPNIVFNNKITVTSSDTGSTYRYKITLDHITDDNATVENVEKYFTIKYLGNKVFDISKITAEEFTVTLSISVYNLINDLETPIIRGIFGYVTN